MNPSSEALSELHEQDVIIGESGVTYDRLKLSTQQVRILRLPRRSQGYRGLCVVDITGPIDLDRLSKTWQTMVQQHDMLRARFVNRDHYASPSDDYLIVSEYVPPDFSVVRFDSDSPEMEQGVSAILKQHWDEPMLLQSMGCSKITVILVGPVHAKVIFSAPSLFVDSGALIHLAHKMCRLYDNVGDIDADVIQYDDYIQLQHEASTVSVSLEEKMERSPIHSDAQTLRLPEEGISNGNHDTGDAWVVSPLDESLTERIDNWAKQQKISPEVFLLGCWQVLFARLSGEYDFTVDVCLGGREYAALREIVGPLLCWLPIPCRLRPNMLVSDVVTQTQRAWNKYDNAISSDSNFTIDDTTRVDPVAASSTAYEYIDLGMPYRDAAGCEFHISNVRYRAEDTKLKCSWLRQGKALVLQLQYNQVEFTIEAIERIAGYLCRLIDIVIEGTDQLITRISLLSTQQHQLLLRDWNDTMASYAENKSFHDLFSEQVARTPDSVAVDTAEGALTYRELSHRVDRLAEHLITDFGLQLEDRLALIFDHSEHYIISVLAAAQAGVAFVPIEPRQPHERISFIVRDAAVKLVLTDGRVSVPLVDVPVISIVSLPERTSRGTTDKRNKIYQDSLAYIIYTSGTTGQPKGVAVPQRGLSNLVSLQTDYFSIGADRRVLLFASIGFDASIWEMVSIANGATICIPGEERLAPGPDLVSSLCDRGIDFMTLSPTALALLPAKALHGVRGVVTAGDVCTKSLLQQWGPDREFFNGYGPTEATVCATLWRGDASCEDVPPIGRPIANTQTYILDTDLNPCPIGVSGELYIGGVGLARGYINRPALTAEYFLPDAWSGQTGARVYRTGDRARFLPNGEIEYLGRLDHQVKLRGFRIEPGEIETALRDHPSVRQAVVVVREDQLGDRRLVGYVVGSDSIESDTLKQFLSDRLPDYMVPSRIVMLDAFPLSTHGKVDRKALPMPHWNVSSCTEQHVVPRDALEQVLVDIWKEVLKVDSIGVNDDFFEFGGHSLLATQVAARLRNTFRMDIPLRAFFEGNTIARLARILVEQESASGRVMATAELVQKIKQMSPDERQSALLKMKSEKGESNV